MNQAYTIKEAQRRLASVVRTVERGNLATITRHDRPVAYVTGAGRLAAIAETMEILANPAAMTAIRAAETNKGRRYATSVLPE